MTAPPLNPRIYHITHMDNLALIVEAGCLWSDAKRVELGLNCEIIGMSDIKRRRLQELPVSCHPGTKVGDYVPFYFCPRSIMLYLLHMGNAPGLDYRGGQEPIVHLEADLRTTIRWAEENGVRWAVSSQNAGSRYAEFWNTPGDLDEINWEAVASTDFRHPLTKEGKQAEFLLFESFPWELVARIGVHDDAMARRANNILRNAPHIPTISTEAGWYY